MLSLVLGDLIGEGGSASVFRARECKTNREVAIKALSRTNARYMADNELSALKRLGTHPNIVELIDGPFTLSQCDYLTNHTVKQTAFAMELLENGELFPYVASSCCKAFSETMACHYITQILSAISYCHRRGVYHRDLKLDNIMLDANFNVKLVDFGFSRVVESKTYEIDGCDTVNAASSAAFDNSEEERGGARNCDYYHVSTFYTSTICGSEFYMPPELWEAGDRNVNIAYDPVKVDAFACGVILFMMLFRFAPFKYAKESDPRFVSLKKGKHSELWRYFEKFGPSISDLAKDLILKLLCPDPRKRISIEEALSHPLLTSAIPLTQDEVMAEMLTRKNSFTAKSFD